MDEKRAFENQQEPDQSLEKLVEMEDPSKGAEQLEAKETAPVFAVTDEILHSFLSPTFDNQPGWVVRKRENIPSFQQYLERIEIDWSEPSDGASHDDTRCETVFLRVYRGFMSWWSLATLDLPQREQTAWRVASRAGVPVPETLWTMESPEIAVALQRLSLGQSLGGITMTDALEVALGQMLARLHRARIETADRNHLPDITLALLFPRLLSWAEEANADELAASARRLQRRFSEEIVELPAVFLHGDFHGGNVLVDLDSGSVTAVIDWEEAAYGDPRLDICVMESVLRRRFNGAGQAFVAAYEEASGIVAGQLKPWEELCGVRSQIVGAWVKEQVTRGNSLPTARPEAWY